MIKWFGKLFNVCMNNGKFARDWNVLHSGKGACKDRDIIGQWLALIGVKNWVSGKVVVVDHRLR